MYKNYGDRDFFEYGILVDDEHEENVYDMLLCRPYSDNEDLFWFAHVAVDITDSWIDKKAVMEFSGIKSVEEDPIRYAIACTEYYSWDNFGAYDYAVNYDWRFADRDLICSELKHYLIAKDNLEVTW